jgi:S1-C subfamily serine protease
MARAPLAALVTTVCLALSGCGHFVDGAGQGPVMMVPPRVTQTAPPPADTVETVRHSVVKVSAPAEGCGRLMGGSGFVVAPQRVLTAAHVVSGSDSVSVDADGTVHDAQVVSYDENADVAVLDVPGLTAEPLSLAGLPVSPQTEAVALGYPGGGDLAVVPARVGALLDLTGPNLSHTARVTRAVYIVSMSGGLPRGASGGPLIDRSGRVLGVLFGNDVKNADTGFALTSVELTRHTARLDHAVPVATGRCAN